MKTEGLLRVHGYPTDPSLQPDESTPQGRTHHVSYPF
jgi:hypothetical protein